MIQRERIVIVEGLDEQDVVIREPVPAPPSVLIEWAREMGGCVVYGTVEVVYVPPRSRRAA